GGSARRGVDAEEVRDGGGGPPAPAAFGGDSEARDEAPGHLHPPPGALDAVGVVDEAEVELGLGPKAQVAQRRVVRVVEALAGDGEGYSVERPTHDPGEGGWGGGP